mgnify:CR=1 FL=1
MENFIPILKIVVPVLVELGLRLYPSEKKISIFRLIASLSHLVADALDKIIPDRQK